MEKRSPSVVIHAVVDVKAWVSAPPGVEVCRPSCCPRGAAASRPPGGLLGLLGHALRRRPGRALSLGATVAARVVLAATRRARGGHRALDGRLLRRRELGGARVRRRRAPRCRLTEARALDFADPPRWIIAPNAWRASA